MSTSNSRNALATSDVRGWLDTMAPDELEAVDIDTPLGSVHGALARIGTMVLSLDSTGILTAHGHAEMADAVNCYRSTVDKMRAEQEEIKRALAALADDPFQAAMVAYSLPDAATPAYDQ